MKSFLQYLIETVVTKKPKHLDNKVFVTYGAWIHPDTKEYLPVSEFQHRLVGKEYLNADESVEIYSEMGKQGWVRMVYRDGNLGISTEAYAKDVAPSVQLKQAKQTLRLLFSMLPKKCHGVVVELSGNSFQRFNLPYDLDKLFEYAT